MGIGLIQKQGKGFRVLFLLYVSRGFEVLWFD